MTDSTKLSSGSGSSSSSGSASGSGSSSSSGSASGLAPVNQSTTSHVLGVIGGSSLFHGHGFAAALPRVVVETEYGGVVAHVGHWPHTSLQVVFVQRHHADTDGLYKQPREINFRAIAAALKTCGCEAVIGVYSVGSMNPAVGVGRLVVPEDYFNPFDILYMSRQYDAHVVPDLNADIREMMLRALTTAGMDPYDGGVYIQTAGPRFETKAEIRFFKQFGELIGMTGANEAELLNELHIPFAMLAIVDNLAHGIGSELTMEAFKRAQQENCQTMETALGCIIDSVAAQKILVWLCDAPSPVGPDTQQSIASVCVDA